MESKIQAKILKYLSKVPECFTVKVITANKSGIPDILVCLKGDFIAFEVKDTGGKATELQKYTMGKIWDAGGEAYVVHSLEEVIPVVERYGQTLAKEVKP